MTADTKARSVIEHSFSGFITVLAKCIALAWAGPFY